MKRMHKIGIGLGVALCLVVGAVAVWSLGATASEDVPTIRVETVQGTVEVKRAGETDFTSADASFQVQPGDEVRTGADGKASIRWGDRGETRLDENTQLTIVSVPADDNAATKTLIELKLSSGRVWSRVLKLLDVDSGFDVKTDGVVATVRGTAFGVATVQDHSQLAVTESVVDVAPVVGGASTLLKEGKWGDFTATGTPTIVRDLTDQDAWPSENKKLDDQFDERLRNEIQERLKKNLSAAPEWLVEFSQGVHLALAPNDQKDDLISKYAGWRIAEAVNDPTKADTMLKFDPSWSKLGPQARDAVLADLRYALFLETPRPGFTSQPGFFPMLQGLRTQFLTADPVGARYALALNLDDQIDGLIFPPAPIPPEDKQTQGEQLLGLIQTWKEGISTDSLSPDDVQTLDDKADALRLRLIDDGGITLPPSDATSTSSTEPTTATIPSDSGSKTAPTGGSSNSTTPAPSTTPTTQACTYQSFSLLAKPASNVLVGQAVMLSLYGTCTSGQVDDLTASSGFSASPSDGSLSGHVFTPSHIGTINLYGTHGSKTVSTMISVVAGSTTTSKKTLMRVSAGAIGPTSLTTGQSAPLTATAYYSDGSTSDVVYQCVWTTSDAKLGYISSQRFFAGTGNGTVDAICSYTDGGITKSGSVTFSVSLDPSLTPTSGGGGGQLRTNPFSSVLY